MDKVKNKYFKNVGIVEIFVYNLKWCGEKWIISIRIFTYDEYEWDNRGELETYLDIAKRYRSKYP